jgi:hypothetical protein
VKGSVYDRRQPGGELAGRSEEKERLEISPMVPQLGPATGCRDVSAVGPQSDNVRG